MIGMGICQPCVYIVFLLLKYVVEAEYCRYVFNGPSENILKVCQNNEATGSVIYLDSTGAPKRNQIVCTCILTHYQDNRSQIVYINTMANSKEGHEFEINNDTFKYRDDQTTTQLETGSTMLFRQEYGTMYTHMCLKITTVQAVGEYCKSVFHPDDSEAAIIQVCQNNKATGSVIHLDSTGAPVGVEIVCTCDFTHYKDTDKQEVHIVSTSNGNEGIEFEFNNITFQHNRKSIQVYLETGSSIIFRQKSEVMRALICLRLEALPYTNNITVECNSLARPNQPHKSSTFSTISTTETVSQTTGKHDVVTKSTVKVTGVTDYNSTSDCSSEFEFQQVPNNYRNYVSPSSTIIAEHARDENGDKNTIAGIVGGTAAGGVFLVIMVVVAVVVVRQRRARNDIKGDDKGGANTARYVNAGFHATHVAASDKSLVNIHNTKDNDSDVDAVDNVYECPELPTEYEIMETPNVLMDNDNAESQCYENQHMAISRNVYELLDKNKFNDASYESLTPV